MGSDRSIRRYRRWYARLLRLYPGPYYERFGEPMEQTFADLLRERGDAKRGLHGVALEVFAETLAEIIRENMTGLIRSNWNVIRWVLVTAAVLLVPFLAMQLDWLVPDPGSSTREGVDWSPMDFAIAGVLVLGTGLLYQYATGRAGNVAHRAAVAIAVAAGLLLIWVNLAVGMIGREGNPANLLYLGVLAVLLIGAAIARFEPREASLAMFATALVHALVAVIALLAGLGPTLLADAFFVAMWLASALLFRRAGQRAARRHDAAGWHRDG